MNFELQRSKKNEYTAASSISIYDSMVDGELSFSSAVHNKDSVVRIVLASRMVEVYDSAISAHSVMQKYPGLCLAHPDIFKRPHESLVGRKEILLPGQKFYLVPRTTVEKLQRKNPRTERTSEEAGIKGADLIKVDGEETVCSAKDFYVSNDEWKQCFMRRVLKKAAYEPPIKKAMRMRKGVLDGWKPALTSVEEISP